jgi:formate dehydrogenase subunit delta
VNIDNLVKMANQIGTFFESDPSHEQAIQGIANHLLKFWDPRMRQQLVAFVENSPDGGLLNIVRESISAHKANLVPDEPGGHPS